MKILYIHQHYQQNKGGTRSYELSKHFINQGAEVTMITGQGDSGQTKEGIQIKTTATKYEQKMSKNRRILAFLHFLCVSLWLGLREKNVDIIYATSTPLTVGIIGLVLSKIKRKPFIFEVRDVWPDIPIALGYIQNKYIIKYVQRLERKIYKHAAHIVVLSSGMKANLIQKGVPEEKVTIAENLANTNLVNQIIPEKPLLPFNPANTFTVVHPGTMGPVNGLEYLIEAAEHLQDRNITFLLIGEGSEKNKLQQEIKTRNLTNVHILSELPKADIINIMQHCDLGAMNVKDVPILWDNSANKFFDFLAVGLPIILNYPGWQKTLIQEYGAGKGFYYKDIEAYCAYITYLANDAKALAKAKKASSKLSKQFDTDKIATKIWNIIITSTNEKRRA
ncbi:glycosyltransferase family 4 protein [Listeria booriae]|uniref:Glycosyltransferase family 4 protein n=1 Tax=Listeria booriae TaxID=1552123 RepID=A0A841Y1L7_9LIST|nr:glycosyltransferase family 4 protein [Listeria booriae]MBC1371536.1 glycosyltransferase family 4 protein [Listeria booriae]